MTIDEAIKHNENFRETEGWGWSFDRLNAFNLGIEALKLVLFLRCEGSPYDPAPLPGETVD